MTTKVLVELGPVIDTADWARRHAMGQVPDRVPYGLHRLADEGMCVSLRTPPRWAPIAQVSRLAAKVTGGARWPEGLLSRPSPSIADVQLCWEERCGIPALMSGPKKRPVITGILWNTEREANLSPFARWISKVAFRRADAVFVHSSAQVEVLRDEWGIPGTRIHVVHFGIDADFWDPAAPFGPEPPGALPECEHPLVMSVGNDRHRDHGLLLEAMRQVHTKLPDVRVELVTSRPQLIPPELGTWRQSLTHPQLRDLHRRSQVVAIATRPNIHISGITAVLESMAMGKPVVVTCTPGFEDYIENGKTGILVPPNNPDTMARALIELVTDPDRCQRIGASARESVLANFTSQAMCQRLAKMIRSVV